MVTVIPSVSNICRGGCVCYHKNCHRLVESRTKEKRWRPGHWTLRVTCSFVEGGGLSSRARFIGGVSSNCTQFPLRNTGHRCLWSQAVTCDLIPSPGRWTDPLSLESDQQMESGRHLSQESSRRERCSANTWLPFSPLPSLEQTWGCLRLSSVVLTLRSSSEEGLREPIQNAEECRRDIDNSSDHTGWSFRLSVPWHSVRSESVALDAFEGTSPWKIHHDDRVGDQAQAGPAPKPVPCLTSKCMPSVMTLKQRI